MGSQWLANMPYHYLFSNSIGVRRAEFLSILSQDAACENRKTRGENTKESTVVTANIHVRIKCPKSSHFRSMESILSLKILFVDQNSRFQWQHPPKPPRQHQDSPKKSLVKEVDSNSKLPPNQKPTSLIEKFLWEKQKPSLKLSELKRTVWISSWFFQPYPTIPFLQVTVRSSSSKPATTVAFSSRGCWDGEMTQVKETIYRTGKVSQDRCFKFLYPEIRPIENTLE